MVGCYDKEKKKSYIINYKVENDKIIIKYANKKTKELPYNKETEKTILNIMCSQVKYFNRHIKSALIKEIISFLCAIMSLIIFVVGIFSFCPIFILFLTACASQIFFVTTKHFKNVIDEYKKDKFILKNQRLINDNKNKFDVQLNIECNTIRKINKTDSININNVSEFSLKELYALRDTIKRTMGNQSFNETQKKNKQYTLGGYNG